MNKIYFTAACIHGEHELTFTKGDKSYTYKTYDTYAANRIKDMARRRAGQAWKVAKQLLTEEKNEQKTSTTASIAERKATCAFEIHMG